MSASKLVAYQAVVSRFTDVALSRRFSRSQNLRKTDPADRFVEFRRAAQDLNLKSQVIQRQRTQQLLVDPHRVLFGCDEAFGPLALREGEQLREVFAFEAIVIEKPLASDQKRTEIAQEFFEALRRGD